MKSSAGDNVVRLSLPAVPDATENGSQLELQRQAPLSDPGGTTTPRNCLTVDQNALALMFEKQSRALREWQDKLEHLIKAQHANTFLCIEQRTEQLLHQYFRQQTPEGRVSSMEQQQMTAALQEALAELHTPRGSEQAEGNADNDSTPSIQLTRRPSDSEPQSTMRKSSKSRQGEEKQTQSMGAANYLFVDGGRDDIPEENWLMSMRTSDAKKNFKQADSASNRFKQRFMTQESRKTGMPNVASQLFNDDGDLAETDVVNGTAPSWLVRIVNSTYFDFLVAFLIGLNTISIGAQTHWKAEHLGEEDPEWWKITEICFCCVFSVEVIMRIVVERKEFATGRHKQWNFFDSLVVGFSLVELAVPDGTLGQNRTLRVLRLVRVFRIIRVMRFLHELRKMISGIVSTLAALFWAMVLLVMVMFIFGVIMTENVMEIRQTDDYDESLNYNYGSLSLTLYSLFKSISGGQDWGELSDPLISYSWVFGLLFIMYVAFAVFCVLNIVTAVFVDHANSICQDEDLRMHRKLVKEINSIFTLADQDGDGRLAFEEFQDIISKEQVQVYLRKLDLDVETIGAKNLFDLLDLEKRGEIDVETFIRGVVRLKGKAKSFDMYSVQETISLLHDKIEDTSRATEKRLEKMLSWMDSCQKRVVGLDEAVRTKDSTVSQERKKWQRAITKLGTAGMLSTARISTTSSEDQSPRRSGIPAPPPMLQPPPPPGPPPKGLYGSKISPGVWSYNDQEANANAAYATWDAVTLADEEEV